MNKALIKTAKISSECIIVPKLSQGYGYKYADLTAILNALNPYLIELGLGVSQSTSECAKFIETTSICCELGDTYMTRTELIKIEGGKNNAAQNQGAGETYARRYGLSKHFNLCTDEDVDANLESRSEPVYTASPSDKAKLLHSMKERGIDDIDTMKALSEKLKGKPWRVCFEAIKEAANA